MWNKVIKFYNWKQIIIEILFSICLLVLAVSLLTNDRKQPVIKQTNTSGVEKQIKTLKAEVSSLKEEQTRQDDILNKAWAEIFQLQDQDEVISKKFKHQ